MILRLFAATFYIFTCSIPLITWADEAQAKRVAEANYQYCIQESLANDHYCRCVSNVYEENLRDVQLTNEEEQFITKGLSGQLAFDALGAEELKLSDSITQKLDNPAFEEGFANCFAFIEDDLAEYDESTHTESLTDEQLRAIQESEAIEEMEDEEED